MKEQMNTVQKSENVTKKQNGVTMIEYALIAALVAIAALVTLGTLGNNINTKFSNVATAISA